MKPDRTIPIKKNRALLQIFYVPGYPGRHYTLILMR